MAAGSREGSRGPAPGALPCGRREGTARCRGNGPGGRYGCWGRGGGREAAPRKDGVAGEGGAAGVRVRRGGWGGWGCYREGRGARAAHGHSLGDLGVQVADPEAVPVLQRALGQDGGVLQRQRLASRLHGSAEGTSEGGAGRRGAGDAGRAGPALTMTPRDRAGRGRSLLAQAVPRPWRRLET